LVFLKILMLSFFLCDLVSPSIPAASHNFFNASGSGNPSSSLSRNESKFVIIPFP
jgi:hypothetical protein